MIDSCCGVLRTASEHTHETEVRIKCNLTSPTCAISGHSELGQMQRKCSSYPDTGYRMTTLIRQLELIAANSWLLVGNVHVDAQPSSLFLVRRLRRLSHGERTTCSPLGATRRQECRFSPGTLFFRTIVKLKQTREEKKSLDQYSILARHKRRRYWKGVPLWC